ncbi:hypothetical protein [Primorskyibacter flagellatus]|uniref:Uncharacterized protein n=1 Tax=Primorskyibacter flagellatus TaxID=1387277 RepID=A0A1W2ERI1_9RHOB|nr:hypothetical protein [Primorskyibacter flagellatus]SMD12291.1 hypothetical protein SAMN06295998_1403 [Primorskyibacter flagellatus]
MPKLSAKAQLAQKVLVRTINEFLRCDKFGLTPDKNNFDDSPLIEFEMDGIPAIAHAHDAGHGEISIKVALWPTDKGKELISAAIMSSATRRKMGGFYTSAWLERKDGAWLQTSNGLTASCAKNRRTDVEALPWEDANGFGAEGKFYL